MKYIPWKLLTDQLVLSRSRRVILNHGKEFAGVVTTALSAGRAATPTVRPPHHQYFLLPYNKRFICPVGPSPPSVGSSTQIGAPFNPFSCINIFY
jgi:hypothetical protein